MPCRQRQRPSSETRIAVVWLQPPLLEVLLSVAFQAAKLLLPARLRNLLRRQEMYQAAEQPPGAECHVQLHLQLLLGITRNQAYEGLLLENQRFHSQRQIICQHVNSCCQLGKGCVDIVARSTLQLIK